VRRGVGPGFAMATLLVVLCTVTAPILAHTGYEPIPIFIFSHHPDFPFESYVRGQMGIVLPSFDYLYLFMAYRNLTGQRFTEGEIRELRSVWEPSINGRMKQNQEFRDAKTHPNSRARWFKRRGAVRGVLLSQRDMERLEDPSRYVQIDGAYTFFLNCLDDAFRNALTTLSRREKTFGPASREVNAWAEAQDLVFANCPGRDPAGAVSVQAFLPAPTEKGDPPLLRADRAYQMAAAHLYAMQYDEARAGFDAIAEDSGSPWHDIAPYLAARAMIRKGSVAVGPGKIDRAALGEAEERLQALLTDHSRGEWHEPARKLLAFVRTRLYPRERCVELATKLAKTGSAVGGRQDVEDYVYLLTHATQESACPNDDMTDWISTFQSESANNASHALARWQSTRREHWLLAAIKRTPSQGPRPEALLGEAENIPSNAPGFWTARFLRARQLAEIGRVKEAREELDHLLAADHAGLPKSSENLLLALRMKTAKDLDDFLRFAPRQPASLIYEDEYALQEVAAEKSPRDSYLRWKLSEPHLDGDARAILNTFFSLSLLARATTSADLPRYTRAQIGLMAFTRAVLVADEGAARTVARNLSDLLPELRADLQAYLEAKTEQSREFAAVFLILRIPAMMPAIESSDVRTTPLEKISDYRHNWWCSFEEGDNQAPARGYYYERWWDQVTYRLAPLYPIGEAVPPSFLSGKDLETARAEWSRLQKAETAVDWLGKRAMAWAKAHPDDPRVPEALHHVVRTTRYGCGSADSGVYSKQAFNLLHRRYPKNEWTVKTPYWFQ